MSAREKAKLPRQTGLRLYLFWFPCVDKAGVSDHALLSPDALDEDARRYANALA
jgi:hypothetical protein